jgi:hypothetical protein
MTMPQRQGDKEKRRQEEEEMERNFFLSSCLLVFLSPLRSSLFN